MDRHTEEAQLQGYQKQKELPGVCLGSVGTEVSYVRLLYSQSRTPGLLLLKFYTRLECGRVGLMKQG